MRATCTFFFLSNHLAMLDEDRPVDVVRWREKKNVVKNNNIIIWGLNNSELIKQKIDGIAQWSAKGFQFLRFHSVFVYVTEINDAIASTDIGIHNKIAWISFFSNPFSLFFSSLLCALLGDPNWKSAWKTLLFVVDGSSDYDHR